MSYQAIQLDPSEGMIRVTLNRPEHRNSINPTLLNELHQALDLAESMKECRVVVIEGTKGIFSAGMDLGQAAEHGVWQNGAAERGAREFLGLLRRLTITGRIIVSSVDGEVVGGGVGLTSASDFVFATERSQFSLPEALWGLIPCCVLPFLIRRIGFQKARTMALSTQPVSAREGEQFHLVDKIAPDGEQLLRKLLFRASRLSESIVKDLKHYLNKMSPISPEIETTATQEFARLLTSGVVQQRIMGFASHQRFPWEN
jgi:3-carboxymethyl-3-hydroxy-acyl-[acp] dehydratase